MLSSLFDEYSINARVRPALLALLPITVFSYLAFPPLYELLAGSLSIFVVFGLVTALAHFSRSAGRAAEARLHTVWGGKPTTIVLRHRDSQIDRITKRRYHEFLAKNIESWEVPSEQDELRDPLAADQVYDSAVRWLLEHTRDQKRYAMLFKENIGYGFRRNCYGIRWVGAMLALAPIVVIGIDCLVDQVSLVHIGAPTALVSAALSLLMLFWWIFVVKESWVREAATAYAVRLLAACETDRRT